MSYLYDKIGLICIILHWKSGLRVNMAFRAEMVISSSFDQLNIASISGCLRQGFWLISIQGIIFLRHVFYFNSGMSNSQKLYLFTLLFSDTVTNVIFSTINQVWKWKPFWEEKKGGKMKSLWSKESLLEATNLLKKIKDEHASLAVAAFEKDIGKQPTIWKQLLWQCLLSQT